MIILTGASGGIGKGIISQLSEIDEVIGFYNTTTPENENNDRIVYEKLDIENPVEIKEFIKKNGKKLDRLTLVHCAALKIDSLAANLKLSDWDRVTSVNLRANFILTQALLPYMIKEKWGRIIHLSSRGGLDGAPGTIAYSASKAALIGASNVLAKEYARFNISSNVLILGTFETGMFLDLSDAEKQKILNQIPSKKLGELSDISNAIEFLIKSGYVNAAAINIDGAM